MTLKSISILGALTVVAVGAAGYSLNANRAGPGVEMSGAVFPGLIEGINTIDKVVVEHRNKTLTMVRSPKGAWTMDESDGYAVSAKNAEKVVVQLADLNFYETKTKKPDLYSRLHVEDPKKKQSEARHIRLFDKDGKVLVDLIAGRKRHNLVGARKEGVYIRKPGNAQTWLAAGELSVGVKSSDWLERKIVDIKEKDVLSVTLRHSDGEVIKVSKEDAKARNFALHGIPDGKTLEYDTDPNNIAAVIDQLELDDVRKAGYIAFDGGKTTTAEFITRDGLKLEFRVVDKDRTQWVELKASAIDGAPAPKEGKSAAERANEINARVKGWVYALPGFKGSRLKRHMADMLKDKKPAS